MAKENLILICASLIITQLVIVHCINEEDIDWATFHADLRKLAGSLRKKCIGEIGIAEGVLDEAAQGNFDDPLLPCYFRCIMDKGGAIKKDGKINYKLLSKMLPGQYRHIGQAMLDQCREIDPGNHRCDIAINFNKCMQKANPLAYFVI